ncbi:hypothetical protein [Glaciecola petra]|uniref:Uncharacterized protein n=1 Tax=Glaciecola petra TaxID=3075602 RepID=A0ABU2ZP67_9ALTE|nr:hypothetical protein [Aestuariibacter sp. P117]MDT0594419.1 hypothetical protein [Aestuariibacter sp. P117]
MSNQYKIKEIERRLEKLQNYLLIAKGYLNDGSNAEWHGFRAFYSPREKNGKIEPPNKDWITNVFIPSKLKQIAKSEDQIESLERAS